MPTPVPLASARTRRPAARTRILAPRAHFSGPPPRTLVRVLAFSLLAFAAFLGAAALGGQPSAWSGEPEAGLLDFGTSSASHDTNRILHAGGEALFDARIQRRSGLAARRLQDLAPRAPTPRRTAQASAPSSAWLAACAAAASAVGILLVASNGTSSPSRAERGAAGDPQAADLDAPGTSARPRAGGRVPPPPTFPAGERVPATPSQQQPAFAADWGAGPIATPSTGPPLFSQASSAREPQRRSPSRTEARDYEYPGSQGYTFTRSGDTRPHTQPQHDLSEPAIPNIPARASSPSLHHQDPPQPPNQAGAHTCCHGRHPDDEDTRPPPQGQQGTADQQQNRPAPAAEPREEPAETPTKWAREHAISAQESVHHTKDLEAQARETAASLVADAMAEEPLRDRQDALWVLTTLEGRERDAKAPEPRGTAGGVPHPQQRARPLQEKARGAH